VANRQDNVLGPPRVAITSQEKLGMRDGGKSNFGKKYAENQRLTRVCCRHIIICAEKMHKRAFFSDI
jgi:hypothetical protein